MVRQTRHKALIDGILGKTAEPKYDKLESQSDIAAALNWYNSHKDAKSAVRYISEYAKKNKIKGRLDTSKSYQSTGFLCRIINNGTIVSDELITQTKEKVIELLSKDELDETEDDSSGVVISIQDRMRDKVSEIAGDLEGALDEYVLGGFIRIPSPYGVMHGRVKGKHAKMLIPIFEKHKNEFQEVLDTDDKDLKDGYSNFSRAELKKLVAFCNLIIEDAEKLSAESKATKKPRKKIRL
jgi:hypothetical protein